MITYEIAADDIRHNIKVILERVKVPVWGVVKFDGYGMGLEFMAGLLREGGVTRFAVACGDDVRRLRESGFTQEDILLICPPDSPEDIAEIIRHGGIFSIGSMDTAKAVKSSAEELGMTARMHIEVDTGLGRYGFLPSRYGDIKALYTDGSGTLSVEGIYTHYRDAFSDRNATMEQHRIFSGIISQLKSEGIDVKMAHIANSAALFKYGGPELDAVRVGSALVGRVAGITCAETGLKRVGALCSQVAEVRRLPEKHHVGYASTFKTRRPTDVAVITVGRWHGVPDVTGLLHRHPVMVEIGGKKYPVLDSPGEGNVLADVTGCGVLPGDRVRFDINPLKLNLSVKKVYI